ncbi:hypothetical protein L1887_13289 [Cichorium endivia]|nr:hypothetical protein L1887_13289 [Cichorium endivia]
MKCHAPTSLLLKHPSRPSTSFTSVLSIKLLYVPKNQFQQQPCVVVLSSPISSLGPDASIPLTSGPIPPSTLNSTLSNQNLTTLYKKPILLINELHHLQAPFFIPFFHLFC